MKKKKKKIQGKITIEDYIKAVKKADREIQLNQSAGWQRSTNIHKSRKAYDRKAVKDQLRKESNE